MLRSVARRSMKVVGLTEFGGADKMFITRTSIPKPQEGEVLIKVKATAVNRADIVQREGHYPPPPGETPTLGLEASGIVMNTCGAWKEGDHVMALLQGGGYAEYVTVPSTLCMHKPKGLTFTESACIPETWLTAYQHLHLTAKINKEQSILIHAGASGVGTAAIQLSKLFGIKNIIASVGSKEKEKFCLDLGATSTYNYKEKGNDTLSKRVKELTDGRGVDVILDPIGASVFNENARSFNKDGIWVLYGFLGGSKIKEYDLKWIFSKRLTLICTTLRSRSLLYRTNLVNKFQNDICPSFEDRTVSPIIYTEMNIDDIAKAHQLLETNKTIGKIAINI
eukprot:GHVR01076140.1.p1 GENE.GHVR01076140.1~~GHVR01076140.1.p1  ORF type:complete len:337 (-),score=82.01 GHVR01076140.1:121-1131(-)